MVKVESFSLDHTKVKAPFVRKCEVKIGEKGDIVTKFDIRFMQPNEEFMEIATIHTLEHLLAGYMREEMEQLISCIKYIQMYSNMYKRNVLFK